LRPNEWAALDNSLLGLSDPFELFEDTLNHPSYHGWVHGKLDWLLSDRRLEARSRSVFNYDYAASDHRGLVATYRLVDPVVHQALAIGEGALGAALTAVAAGAAATAADDDDTRTGGDEGHSRLWIRAFAAAAATFAVVIMTGSMRHLVDELIELL
jgi:hypothetical protein